MDRLLLNNPKRPYSQNPLFRVLTRDDQAPPLATAVRFGGLVFTLTLLATLLAGLVNIHEAEKVTGLICSAGIPIGLFTPIWMTHWAALFYRVLHRRLSGLELIHLTLLSEKDIFWGFFNVTLYRARFTLAFLAAMMALLVMAGAANPDIQRGYITGGLELTPTYRASEYAVAGLFWGIVGSALCLLYPLAILVAFTAAYQKKVLALGALLAWVRMLGIMVALGIGTVMTLAVFKPNSTGGMVMVAGVCCFGPIALLIIMGYLVSLQQLRRLE